MVAAVGIGITHKEFIASPGYIILEQENPCGGLAQWRACACDRASQNGLPEASEITNNHSLGKSSLGASSISGRSVK